MRAWFSILVGPGIPAISNIDKPAKSRFFHFLSFRRTPDRGPGSGLPVRCLTASDLAQAGTQTGMTMRGLFTKPSTLPCKKNRLM